MEELLNEIYYNTKSPSAFSGVEKVYLEAKQKMPSITRREVREWLEKQYTYTMHKPIRKKFPRRSIYVKGMDDQWQVDLADMTRLSRYNNGYQYLLTCIDIYSKYAWVVPLKNKGGEEVAKALDSIFKQGRVPKKVQTDKGREFLNRIVRSLLEQYGVHHFTSEDPQIKCAVVERFNRTIKERIWKYFTKYRTHRYINVLADIVNGYNNSKHRTIGQTPASINSTTKVKSHSLRNDSQQNENRHCNFNTLMEGDTVRISRSKMIFEKGYLPNWTEELFSISECLPTNPPTYKLQDYYGEPITGSFYAQELQKTQVDEFWIEKVIKKRKNQALVKWLGYKKPEWIPIESIINYKKV